MSAPLDDGIDIPNFTLFSSTEKKLLGCLMGSCSSLHEILRLLRLWQSEQPELDRMVTRRLPLEEVNEAFNDLRAGVDLRTVTSITQPRWKNTDCAKLSPAGNGTAILAADYPR